MDIKRITLERFRKIKRAEINLCPINVLVGGNNSGKSSVLQGIHFSLVAATAARRLGKQTFTQDNLLFCPTRNFVTLRNGGEYQNQSNFGYLRIAAKTEDEEDVSYVIRVYRARNEGNVGCERSGNTTLGGIITEAVPPFSIYVPGLAGVPQVEEYRSESVVRKGVASGDANLYLRNVIYLIEQKKLKNDLIRLMRRIFPGFSLSVEYDPVHDSYLDVFVLDGPGGQKRPLELTGTGILQALQIFSYATLFKPKLMLLDEPDAHLHPDNQLLLSEVLLTIASETNSKIIVSTHSRHMVDALNGEANFVWLKKGEIFEQGDGLRRLPLLMDIGALDSFEKLREGETKCVVLTEDRSTGYMEKLLEASGFNLDELLIYSYQSSSNLNAAGALSEFIREIAPETKVVVHADNDFFTAEEAEKFSEKIVGFGAIPFITEGSDIESYFVDPEHIGNLLEEPADDVNEWLSEIAQENHNELAHKFSRKRDDAKFKLYKRNEGDPPPTLNLMGPNVPLEPEKRLGKFMLRKVRGGMRQKFGKEVSLQQITEALSSPRLVEIVEEM